MVKKHKLALQLAAFLTIMASAVGLYVAASADASAPIVPLLGVTAAAMMVALIASLRMKIRFFGASLLDRIGEGR